MFVLEKFLFYFELEVGAFAVGMFGFTTSFLIELFIVMLLYQTDCLGLFKLYTCATIVAYYMFASFMLVKEIFCDVSILKKSKKNIPCAIFRETV
jgi:hypothetical protein